MASGTPCDPAKILTSLRQYTVSMAITEQGRTRPKYKIISGVFLPKAKNGRTRRKFVINPAINTI